MKIGDTVFLKSGGPEMEVIAVHGEWITVRWFDERTSAHDIFPAAALERTAAIAVH